MGTTCTADPRCECARPHNCSFTWEHLHLRLHWQLASLWSPLWRLRNQRETAVLSLIYWRRSTLRVLHRLGWFIHAGQSCQNGSTLMMLGPSQLSFSDLSLFQNYLVFPVLYHEWLTDSNELLSYLEFASLSGLRLSYCPNLDHDGTDRIVAVLAVPLHPHPP